MQLQVIEKFTIAQGSTGPTPGDAKQAERADALVRELLTDRWYGKADGVMVARCIDERLSETLRQVAEFLMAPNAAGGTMTLVVADILTGGRITGAGTTAERFARMVDHLQSKGLLIGAHFDDHDHSKDGGSGCGACDKLGLVFAFMADMLDGLCDYMRKELNIEIDDVMIEDMRRELQSLPELSKGAETLSYLKGLPDGAVLIEKMLGLHDALAVMLNFIFGTTLKRKELAKTDRSAFNVDCWAFDPSARAVYGENDERQIKFAVAAMALYNLATGGVLCSNEIRVGIRR